MFRICILKKEDIDYLRSLNQFSEDFLEYLSTIRFTGDIYAIPEGTPVFPHEPLVRVKAPIIEAQLVETALLLAINHQTLIATKSRRIVQASEGRAVMEFGARRAHNFDAAILGARASLYCRLCGKCHYVFRKRIWCTCTWYNGALIYSKLRYRI